MANEKIEDVIKKVILGENFLAENSETEEVEELEEAKKDAEESEDEESEDEGDESSEDEDEDEEEEDKKPAFLKGKFGKKGKTEVEESAEINAMSMTDLRGKKYIEKSDVYSSDKLYKTANGKTANIGNAIDLDNSGAEISDDNYNRNTIKPKASAANGKVEKPKASVKESVEALFAGKELSEEFMSEAETLFEAHLAVRAEELEEELQGKYATLLEEHTLAVTEEMVERIDEYLNYVVEEWMQENRLAVNNGLRTEITEGFIERLKGVFAESYIEVPEEKLDLFESTVEDFETLKTELDEQVSKNMEINEENEQLRCELLFREIAEGLTDTETQKLRNLAESVEFDSVEQFAEKLAVLRENIENIGSVAAVTETTKEDSLEESYEEGSDASPLMEAYIRSMSKSKD
jgi:hypothetical protein